MPDTHKTQQNSTTEPQIRQHKKAGVNVSAPATPPAVHTQAHAHDTPATHTTPAPVLRTPRTYHATGTPLTARQQAFAQAYVRTRNGTKSAIIAGYSPDTAYSLANENLKKPEVKNEIERLFMLNVGLSLAEVQQIHKRNMLQQEHLPTSQRAIQDYYRVTGYMRDDTKPSVAIQFNIEQ